MNRFQGQVAIVTGGAGNIGRATALRLASEGASVTVADLDAGAAERVVDEIAAAGGTARADTVDVADPEAVVQAAARRFPFPAEFIRPYLRRLRYEFGPAERSGLEAFLTQAAQNGELDVVPRLAA